MKDNSQIDNLEEKISKRKISELVPHLKSAVDLTDVPCNLPGYCASDKETFKAVSEYIASELDIPDECIIDYNLENGWMGSFVRGLHDEKNGDLLLVRVSNLAKCMRITGHDYDQSIRSLVPSTEFPAKYPKKIVVISHIDTNTDFQKYDLVVRNVCSSQYKFFLYEL